MKKNKKTQKAQRTLEEAVISVLIEHKGGCGIRQISELTGIYRGCGRAGIMNDAIVMGLLNKLHEDKQVKRIGAGENKRNRKWRCV